MRKDIIETVYTIDDHPNSEAVYDWVRDNWHDLGEPILSEMVGSLQALADHVEGLLYYNVSLIPAQGEYVRITGGNKTLLKGIENKECPLTGLCWDRVFIDGYCEGYLESTVLSSLHSEAEYIYSNKGIHERIECNGYYFKLNGEFYQ